jgi:hypothetical protein
MEGYMVRIRTLLMLGVSFAASLAALAATPQRHGSGNTAITVSGAYAVTFNLTIASTLPTGSTITCRAQIVPTLKGSDATNLQVLAAPVETATGIATVNGSTATCTAEIPFSWTLPNSQSTVMLSYEIDAVSTTGGTRLVVRSSLQQNINEALPSAGGTASPIFNVTL